MGAVIADIAVDTAGRFADMSIFLAQPEGMGFEGLARNVAENLEYKPATGAAGKLPGKIRQSMLFKDPAPLPPDTTTAEPDTVIAEPDSIIAGADTTTFQADSLAADTVAIRPDSLPPVVEDSLQINPVPPDSIFIETKTDTTKEGDETKGDEE